MQVKDERAVVVTIRSSFPIAAGAFAASSPFKFELAEPQGFQVANLALTSRVRMEEGSLAVSAVDTLSSNQQNGREVDAIEDAIRG